VGTDRQRHQCTALAANVTPPWLWAGITGALVNLSEDTSSRNATVQWGQPLSSARD